MSIRIFNIGAGTDDQRILRFSASYPPSGTVTRQIADLVVQRSLNSGPSYQNDNALLRFDTSSLPDDAVITAASLQAYIWGKSDVDARSLVAEYYDWDGTSTTDHSNTAPATPILSATIASLNSPASNTIALTDLSGISKLSTTEIRLHISGTQPTGANYVLLYSSEDTANPGSRLIVEYTSTSEAAANGGKSVAVIPVAGPPDDQSVERASTGTFDYPPTGAISVDTSGVIVSRRQGASQKVANGLLRFNTSSLPDNATVDSATLKMKLYNVFNDNSLALTAGYYTWTGVTGDWTNTPETNAISGHALSSLTDDAVNSIPLTGFSGISKTGNTLLRLHISQRASDAAPSGSGGNYITFYNYEHATEPAPELVVYYTVNVAPTANFTYTTTDLSATFTDTSSDVDGSVVAWYWTFGDGASSTSQHPNHTYATAGSYLVTLQVTDDDGATTSTSKTVTVVPPAPPPDVTQGTGNSYMWKTFPKRIATLSGSMNATQNTMLLDDTTYWPQGDSVIIGSEIITYAGKDVINGPGNLTNVSRGQFGTTATSHSSGVEVGLLGRHSLGLLSKHKVPLFPLNGAITLNEQGRWQDHDWFVRCDLANYRELAELSIYAPPSSSGNITVTTDEGGFAVAHPVAVTAAKEKRSLTINAAPTSSGDVTVTLGGVAYTIAVTAAVTEKHQLIYTGGPFTGKQTISFYNASNVLSTIELSHTNKTKSEVASAVRSTSFSGWVMSGSGSTAIATASASGLRGDGSADSLNAGFNSPWMLPPYSYGTHTQLVEGAAGLTAIGVADLIRSTSFPGWATGGTAGTATVTIEALEAGPQTGTFSYSAGTTGATSTSGLTQTTAGAATSKTAVATAIRTTYSGNTYWSAGGTGEVVTFTALTDGAKQDATFNPGTTGTGGLMLTTRNGSPDVVAHIRDSNGVDEQRRVMANIATTTAFNIETSVSGAGTSKAVVSIFGSFGTDPLSLLWRKTKVDLSDHQAGYAAYGVVREFGSGITWDSHSDEVEPTSQAKVFHCDHTETGELIGQAHYYGRLETIQSRNDIFIQDLSIPVIPGEEVVMAAKLRYENVPTDLPAKPLFVTAHHADGTVTDLRDVTGTTGISGTATWNEPTPYTLTVPTSPSPCYEIRVASRDISSGTIVIQELVVSPGTLPKRTYYYATNGTVTVRYDGRTPQETNAMQLGRQRVALETQYEEPAGTLTSEQYRSSLDPNVFDATWHSNPLDVEDRPVIEAEITLEGDGLSTPELLSGFPRFEYKLVVGNQVQPTLNKPDGTEFPGGVVFDKREEWHPNTGIDVRVLPSGRVRRGKTHEPVGYIPKLSLWAFRPEAVKYLMEKWGTEELIADWVDDEVLTLKLLSSPEFERQYGTKDGPNGRAAEWKSKEIAAEVVSVRKRIQQ